MTTFTFAVGAGGATYDLTVSANSKTKAHESAQRIVGRNVPITLLFKQEGNMDDFVGERTLGRVQDRLKNHTRIVKEKKTRWGGK